MLDIEVLDPRRHDRARFGCGEPSLDRYLLEQASQHHCDGVSTTHVLIDVREPRKIIGYHTLAAAQLRLTELQDADRRRLPRYPVSAARMGRLAVSGRHQRKGHGEFLLAHALDRCLGLRQPLGIRVMVVDALNANAASFYSAYGFRPVTEAALTLYLPLGAHTR